MTQHIYEVSELVLYIIRVQREGYDVYTSTFRKIHSVLTWDI